MSEPMGADERARLRAEHEHPTRPDWCDTIRLLDEVDRLTEDKETAKAAWRSAADRAERAEAELAQSESTLAGLRRVHAETVERYQQAEADLADEKRRHAEQVRALTEQGFAVVKFYGEFCSTCHTQSNAVIRPLSALLSDATSGEPQPTDGPDCHAAHQAWVDAATPHQTPRIGTEKYRGKS